MRRHLAVLARLIRNNFTGQALFRANFFTSVGVDIIWMGIEFALFAIIYSHVPTLGGAGLHWTQNQVFFFLGLFFTVDSLYTALFQRAFWRFSDLVQKGDLDTLLLRPVNTVFLALTRAISPSDSLNALLGLSIMAHYSTSAGFAGGILWLKVLAWVLVGLLTMVLTRFLFSVFVFWTERNWMLQTIYYHFFQLGQRPDTLFPKALRYFLMTVIPVAFVASVPSRELFGQIGSLEWLCLAGSITGLWILDFFLWRAGLRRYQSASS